MVSLPLIQIYLDRPNRSQKVMLKVARVLQVVRQLMLSRVTEVLSLQSIQPIKFSMVCSQSPLRYLHLPNRQRGMSYEMPFLPLVYEHNYTVEALQKAYRHLKGLPLQPVDRVKP